MSVHARMITGMSPNPCARCRSLPAGVRLARAQAAIRALTRRGRLARLTTEERLELAEWQREWVQAWRESQYVIAA